MSVSLLVLGVASFLFHASLRHALQFGDELAMLGLAWSLLQGILTAGQTQGRARNVTVVLAVVFPLASVFYVWTGKIIHHVFIFCTMLALIIARALWLFQFMRIDVSDAKREEWRRKGRKALLVLLMAYALWHMDLEFCAELRQMRDRVGLPWAWLLELHGWWHILTAVSASWFMDIVRELRQKLSRDKKE